MSDAAAPTFALQLATAADPATLEAWLARGAVGEQELYASGLPLPRELPGVVLVSRWKDAGLVETHNRRDPGDSRRWQYLVIKKRCASNPLGAPGPSAAATATPQRGRATYHRADHCVATASA